MEIIKTSERDWLEKSLKFYIEKKEFRLSDDAGIGLTEEDLTSVVALIRAAKEKGRIKWQQIVGILAGVGITGIGVWVIYAAVIDPEPTTKLGLLIGGGVLITLTGALGTFASIGIKFSVSAKTSKGTEFEIKPQ